MSMLAYPPTNEAEIFRHCTKECGIISSTEDQQYFALGCISCPEKFLYFDAFIEHMQTTHLTSYNNGSDNNNGNSSHRNSVTDDNRNISRKRRYEADDNDDDSGDGNSVMMEAPVVMIKEEKYDLDDLDEAPINNEPITNNDDDYSDGYYRGKHGPAVKREQLEPDHSMGLAEASYMGDSFGSYGDDYGGAEDEDVDIRDQETNYDDLVEESLLDSSTLSNGITSHIKDRKMIQFLIEAYRRNTFLWDHRHPQFRDRIRRGQFIEWINGEFKKRFNLTLSKDAVTRKWDNLRTVYKRECNRMALEKTNVSTLWYFKELFFLSRLYGGNQPMSEAVIKESVYRRRYTALWNDQSTNKLLDMVKTYPCFYDKYNIDYRSKDKRSEALQYMVTELLPYIEVSTIQISKRISQLRFDYSKQKLERIMCEMSGKSFNPTYSYYGNMTFMDNDIAPFKCDHCPMILNSPRELDAHLMSHPHKTDGQYPNETAPGNSSGGSNYYCPVCQLGFNDLEQFNRHKQLHPALKEVKYNCDLCIASFREKSNYDEHMRRHNDELLLPDLSALTPADNSDEIITNDYPSYGSAHSQDSSTSSSHVVACTSAGCSREFTTLAQMVEHSKTHHSEEEFPCDVCGKAFRSPKNLQNHKQIHDAVKKYICKICGSAFAQAAGLYLHKRRHNRQNST